MISVLRFLLGPFGQNQHYGRPSGRVNAVIHEVPARPVAPVHEFHRAVENLWTPAYPPIANISIRGSSDVAAERSSE